MKRTLTGLLMGMLICTPATVIAQDPMRAMNELTPYVKQYDPYGGLCHLRQHSVEYQGSDPACVAYYHQALATAFSMCGFKRDSTLICFVTGINARPPKQGKVNVDTIDMSPYHAVSARDYICNQASSYNVMMVNEQHHTPYHRLFVKGMLEDLYKQGYRKLSLEALTYRPEGYANVKQVADSGFYTKETAFAQMVRRAFELGYTVNGHEALMEDYTMYNSLNRDSIQAVNLIKILCGDSTTKMLVYAGYGHVAKDDESMYYYFKQLSNITALSVDQTVFNESATERHEKKPYLAFLPYFDTVDQSAVLFDAQNKQKSFDRLYDVSVYWPRTDYLNGRPKWLNTARDAKWVKVKRAKDGVVQIRAYLSDEYSKYGTQIPVVDQLIIEEPSTESYLVLPLNAKYTIVQTDSNNKVVATTNMKI